jgi:hypothetical protein
LTKEDPRKVLEEERKLQQISHLQNTYRHSQFIKKVVKLGPVLKKDE